MKKAAIVIKEYAAIYCLKNFEAVKTKRRLGVKALAISLFGITLIALMHDVGQEAKKYCYQCFTGTYICMQKALRTILVR